MKAATYLGELKAQKVSANKVDQRSKAPAPSPNVGGNAGGRNEVAAKSKYDKAKNSQERWDIKRAAKKSGIDTSKW